MCISDRNVLQVTDSNILPKVESNTGIGSIQFIECMAVRISVVAHLCSECVILASFQDSHSHHACEIITV